VSFDLPGESKEQEGVFVQVERSRNTIKEKQSIALVTGKIIVYANADKLPFGYFAKKIQEAAPADTKDLFFYDIEENAGTYKNIAERSMSFTYFFNSQYNPERGVMNEVTNTVEVSE
jgi:hypothetical protein